MFIAPTFKFYVSAYFCIFVITHFMPVIIHLTFYLLSSYDNDCADVDDDSNDGADED